MVQKLYEAFYMRAVKGTIWYGELYEDTARSTKRAESQTSGSVKLYWN